MTTIPIVILHKDDIINLEIMLNSIYKNTKYSFELFIIDNASSPNMQVKLQEMQLKHNFHLIFSKKNNWLLGFNKVFKDPNWKNNYKYYIFSDCDIEVPFLKEKCWLERMVNQMDENACIGKLGISLKYSDIDKGELYDKIVKQESIFDAQPTIGNRNRIAPVDTTLAIYRTDLFVYKKFKFSIGHASLVRPYYYVCRTNRLEIEARHLGWYNRGVTNNTKDQLKSKIICFANFAAYIEPVVFERMPKYYLFYYKMVKPVAKLYWSTSVIMALLYYYLKNFPRNINMLQNKLR
ncbi:glycosyltransferase family 2 protein [Elizabethkingia anophelis]|nr:glycosyltransferase family 2 protein [Elizabethkingia anophelis]MCT4277154.1 glycosyltransferase family 2 protein [Elizabethkingia anophelis]MCT4280567.1 glycosyltransferase family 2 protein [Elizabethkingia anophelis]